MAIVVDKILGDVLDHSHTTELDTRYLKITDAQATYVPYTGATADVDLGNYQISTLQITTPLIIGTNIKPSSNSTTAIQLQNAAGTSILNVDTTNGRVGIGTTGPGAKLDVSGDIRANQKIQVSNAGTVSNGLSIANSSGHDWRIWAEPTNIGLVIGGSSGTQNFWESKWSGSPANLLKSPTGATSAVVMAVRGAASQTANLQEWQDSTGTALTVIDKNGNVGIGTTSPTNILSITGQSAKTIGSERNTTAATAGQNLTVRVGGAVVGGTNLNGGTLILAGGISTGTGTSGVQIQSCAAGASGTADNALATRIEVSGANIGFFGVTPVARQVVPTGSTTDAVITALQNLGLFSQT